MSLESSCKKNMLPRVCRECGCSFLGGPRAWYCPECRAERQKKHNKDFKMRKRTGNVVPVGSIIKCELCAKEIIKNSGQQRYCEECAAQHLKQIDNQQSLDWKKKNPEKIKESKRKISKQRYATGESHQSGVVGVSWHKGAKKWQAKIYYSGKQYNIVWTKNKELAIQARKEAEGIQLNLDVIEQLKEKYKKLNNQKQESLSE